MLDDFLSGVSLKYAHDEFASCLFPPDHQPTQTGTTVASPPRTEARGVRWSGAQHAHEGRHHPVAAINPGEHGQYLGERAYRLLTAFGRKMKHRCRLYLMCYDCLYTRRCLCHLGWRLFVVKYFLISRWWEEGKFDNHSTSESSWSNGW